MYNNTFRKLVSQGLQPLVIPARRKGPPTKGWPDFPLMSLEEADANDALLLEDKIGLAVSLGPHSNLIAIDVDIRNPEIVDLLFSEVQPTPAIKLGVKGFTCFYKSDGSSHKSFMLPEELRAKIDEPKAKIECLACNHYTILPPSIHPEIEDHRYQWISQDQELIVANLPTFDRAKFIELLQELGIVVEGWSVKKEPVKTSAVAVVDGVQHVYAQGAFQDDNAAKEIVQHCLKHISADCAYDDWYKVGLAINHGITGDKGAHIFREWSSTATNPNFKLADIDKKCNDIFFSTAPTKGKQLTLQHLEYRAKQNPEFIVTREQGLALTIISNSIAANRYDIGDIELAIKEATKYVLPDWLEGKPITSDEVNAEFVIQEMGDNLVAVDKELWVFDPRTGAWDIDIASQKVGHLSRARAKVSTYLMEHPDVINTFRVADGSISATKRNSFYVKLHSTATAIAVSKFVRADHPSVRKVTREIFDADPEVLLISGGRKVCLRTGNITRAVATDYLTIKVDCDISEPGDYGIIPNVVMETFAENEEPEKMVEYMRELLAYFLSGSISRQEIYVFYGSTSNGKSFLIKHLQNVLGTSNDSIMSQGSPTDYVIKGDFSTDKSERAITALVGKRLTVVPDLEDPSGKPIKWSTGLIKILTEPTLAGRLLFKERMQFRNTSKVLFACNSLPGFGVGQEAIARRVMVINFARTFEVDSSDAKRIDNTLRQERHKFLRWLVDARVAENQRGYPVSKPAEVITSTSDYVREQSPLGDIIELACVKDSDPSMVYNSDIAICINQWLQHMMPAGSEYIEVNARHIAPALKKAGFKQADRTRDPNTGKQVRGWYLTLRYPETKHQTETAKNILTDLVN